MVLFNYSTKELTAKVVYYGPGLCGKTTNLQWIHEKLPIKNKGKMLSLATETDRTLFFDFLPIELGTIRGMRTRVQLYTVPGQVFYNATRRMVLKGADCVVFVCDSQEPMLDANLESLENLKQNLEANEIDPDQIPLVLQYNKRDLPNALPIEILNERLNPADVPFREAVAIRGQGVEDTLKAATALVFRSLASKYGGADAAPGPAAPAPAAAAAKPAAPEAPQSKTPPTASRRPGTITLPPLAKADGAGADQLLDSLELRPEAEAEELPLDSLTTDASLDGEEEEVIDAEDLGGPGIAAEFSVEEPPAVSVPPPPPRRDSRATLISAPAEAEELRSRLRRPPAPEPELTLDEIDDEEDVEEITLDDAPPAERRAPVRSSPAPAVAASPARMPVAAPAASRSVEVVPTRTAPVSVELTAVPGRTDVTIPVEVRVGKGAAQVNIQLTLTLKIRAD